MDIFDDIKNKRKNFAALCDSESESTRFKNAIKYTNTLILSNYISSVHQISFATTRGKDIYDQFLSIRFLDVYIESSAGILFLVENGLINLAKRELRFLLESVLKHSFVDDQMMKNKFEEKMEKYSEMFPYSNVDFVQNMKHYVEVDNVAFYSSVKSLYKELCRYVHTSKTQLNEKLEKSNKGHHLGFVSAEEIEKLNKLIFRTLEICLVCHFNACGPSTTGDLFINIYDNEPDWKFHKSGFVKKISDSYNYKAERNNKS
ncbi:MAG: hypothetical protein ACXWQQ_02135 [Pseudobdellovibrio sp.]